MHCGSTGDSFHMLPQQMRPDSLFSPFEAALRVIAPTFLQVDDLGGHCLGSTPNANDIGVQNVKMISNQKRGIAVLADRQVLYHLISRQVGIVAE